VSLRGKEEGPALVFTVIALVSIPVVIWVPEKLVDSYGWYARSQTPLTREQYTKAVDDYRKTFAQIMAGVGGIYGLYLLFRRTRATEQTLATTREGQITDRFAKAIEHLGATDKDGKKVLEIRFGGIYALERIARDSARDHWTVMEILSAYVRQNAPQKHYDERTSDVEDLPELDKDVQAAITVIGRRTGKRRPGGGLRFLDLSGVDLRRGFLVHANLRRAYLAGAQLAGANLSQADLTEADLTGANLVKANLKWAKLTGARLPGVDFTLANLTRANLAAATLTGAKLNDANLCGANLIAALVTVDQCRVARIDDETQTEFDRSLLYATTPDASPPQATPEPHPPDGPPPSLQSGS
jgi:Pentapeptide repeats (8 copies)